MTRGLLLFVVLGASLAWSCGGTRTATSPAAPIVVPSVKALEDIAMMALGTPVAAGTATDARARIARGELTIERYVGELLDDPRFARDVAPEIVVNKRAIDLSEEVPWEALRVTEGGVYYLRAPCEPGTAVPVHPWWALDSTVKVCPDSYQPDHLKDPKTGWYCGGDNLDPARYAYCGCGPNLMNCAKDEENSTELRKALRNEMASTLAYVVGHDLPIADVFTMNATVRTGLAEFFYERWRVIQGELAQVSDVRAWPAEGKLAPRFESVPGQHAGVLTAPHMLLYGDTPRARMRNVYNDLWCSAPSSVNVSTEQVLGLGVTDLRDGAGWQKLAQMPICTDCHARLDYGMQFFAGFPSSFVGLVFEPEKHSGASGPLFGNDIHDKRGEASLSPRGFATLAVAQPEFSACMGRDVLDHVFNFAADEGDVRAVAAAYAERPTLKSMVHAALVRYARRESAKPSLDAFAIAAPAPLRTRLEASCGACHTSGQHAFLREATFSPQLLDRLLGEVAFHRMPRPPVELGPRARSALLHAMIFERFQDPASRAEAERYYDGRMRTLPPHRGSALLRLLEGRVGARDEEAAGWTFSDENRHDAVQYSASFVLGYALAALRTCRAAGLYGAALDACVDNALDVESSLKSAGPR